jgi:hypothetical protein
MTMSDGEAIVILRRMDALRDAIAARAPWHDIEFTYDQARSALDRALGARER